MRKADASLKNAGSVIFESGVRTATVKKILRDADLVLLKLDSPLNQAPLEARPQPSQGGENLIALGYPIASPAMKSIDCKLRVVGGRALSDLIGEIGLRNEISQLDYPSLSVPILDLQAPLVPGMSGCPIIDSDGKVAGIGNGGLEKGCSELTCAIDSGQLESYFVQTILRSNLMPATKRPKCFSEPSYEPLRVESSNLVA